MVSSSAHEPPTGAPKSPNITEVPPRKDTFFNLPSAVKPNCSPVDEKNGSMPPSVPAMGVLSKLSNLRK